jgi:hypothetical protein
MPESIIALKPQDVVVLLKLITLEKGEWSLTSLAKSLAMPISSASQSLERLSICNLYNPRRKVVLAQALLEFLVHGLRYAFPAPRGPIVRGFPTAAAAPPLDKVMDAEALAWPPVWTHVDGTVQGYAIVPLYSGVCEVIEKDPALYELLALADALREGRARERKLATAELTERLMCYQDKTAVVT